MNKTVKKTVISLILAIAVLVVGVVTSFAWFYENRDVSSIIQVNISDANYIKISAIENGTYSGSEWTASYEIPEIETKFLPVSSDGEKIYAPNYQTQTVIDDDGFGIEGKVQNGYKALTTETAGEYMYYQEFDFSSERKIDLFLTSESFVMPGDLTGNFNDCGFSSDVVAGAMRVIFQVFDSTDNSVEYSTIWIPNPNYEIKKDGDEYIFVEEGELEEEYSFISGTGADDVIEVESSSITGNKFTLSNGTQVILGEITENVCVATMNAGISKIAIGFYLEGTDRECSVLTGNGKACLGLHFDSEIIS